MKHLSILVLAIAAGITAGMSTSRGDPRSTVPRAIDVLSAIDFLPDADTLEEFLNYDLNALVEIADTTTDEGIRVRAIRSMGLYDSDIARAGLDAAIARYHSAQSGTELLDLIAGVEALGMNGGAAAVPILAPFLDADSRDLRATTARALGWTLAPTACTPLRARQSHEPTAQVHIAIDQALARLGALCGPS